MRFTEGDGDGLGCAAAVDDEHAATASHAVSARQRRMFLFYYTGAAIWFRVSHLDWTSHKEVRHGHLAQIPAG